jgi:ribosomal-protein-alanine N-acetyltransferase
MIDATLYQTARVRLRDLQFGDESAVLSLLSDFRVVRHMLFPLFTPEQADEFVVQAQRMRMMEPLTNFVLAITLANASQSVVGLVGLVINPRHQAGEAWYLLAPTHWGQGYATEAARALVAIGFSELGLHRIWATCVPENLASIRVLEKLGLRREGHQRRNLPIQGRWCDSYLYALLQEEWSQAIQPSNSLADESQPAAT